MLQETSATCTGALVLTTSLDCPELTLKGKIVCSCIFCAPLHLELQVYDLRMKQHHFHSASQ